LPDTVDCLGLGIAPADILMRLARYPKPGAKVDAIETTIQGGGPIPTALVTVARLGFKSSLIAKVGNDIFGDFVVKELHDEGVDTSCIIRSDKLTAIACGWVESQTGRRTIALELQVRVKPSDIFLNGIPRPKIIHLDARDLDACTKLARWGNKNGITVMLDVGSIRNDVSQILSLVDHFVCAEDFALPYTAAGSIPKALAKLQKICHGTVVITSGLKGSIGMEIDGTIVHQTAFKVKTVDTTGAGDAYHGAYIVGLLKDWNLKERLRFASAVAAMKCTKMGGRTAIPTMRQALAFLKMRRA